MRNISLVEMGAVVGGGNQASRSATILMGVGGGSFTGISSGVYLGGIVAGPAGAVAGGILGGILGGIGGGFMAYAMLDDHC